MEKPNEGNNEQQPEGQPRPTRGAPNVLLILIFLSVLAFWWMARGDVPRDTVRSITALEELVEQDKVAEVAIGDVEILGRFVDDKVEQIPYYDEKTKKVVAPKDGQGKPKTYREYFRVYYRYTGGEFDMALDAKYREHGVVVSFDDPDQSAMIMNVVLLVMTIGLFFFVWFSIRRTRDQMMGGGFLSGFNRSPAKRFEGAHQATTFKDVAGLETVKGELQEIVDFLKEPEKFLQLGGRIPKGVLLNGPPGTGKTLLARAVAGQAGVPFYSVNGSEFIQMFVGVGASRVRDLFNDAKQHAPAIIFIDEIDAVGRQRGAGLGGGHDEREQTLNQILSEMDGFNPTESVIVLGATNRPDVLDPALLRPGRFDRHVTVDRPTHKGRFEIFKVHVRDVPLNEDVDLDSLASATVGMTGADIRNVVNEAALWAARNDKTTVTMEDFEYARDKVQMGAKRDEVLKDLEKERTAYHEAGHTITAWFSPGADRVHKVTVIPRGRALGITQMVPEEDALNVSASELRDRLVVLLGGRAAEKIVYDETTVGAENDLERATSMSRRMVTHWGMSERLGPVSYKLSDEDPFLGREMHKQRQFSERTMELIDQEVSRILHAASERANELLLEYRPNSWRNADAGFDQRRRVERRRYYEADWPFDSRRQASQEKRYG